MPRLSLQDLPPEGPLLAIDPGTKTLGLAVSDALRLTANPLDTLRRTKLKPDLARLFEVYDHRACVGLIVGMPLNMDGTSGPRAQSVRALSRSILEHRDVPLAFEDERMTSEEAEEAMLAFDLSRAKRARRIDAMAATLILEAALRKLSRP